MKIGIISEKKIPNDNRSPLSPEQCSEIQTLTLHDIVVQTSKTRCFSDEEYIDAGIKVVSTVEDCDLLIGVKEVPVQYLISNKSYMFFSHTIKKQARNRSLLQQILMKQIRLIDYERLTDENGHRLIGFGHFAGMVGAHNGLMTYGSRTGLFALDRMCSFLHYADVKVFYKDIKWPAIKIVLTGSGRVGSGAARVLDDMGIQKVAPRDFLNTDYSKAVYTQLSSSDYIRCKNDGSFEKSDFYQHPERYEAYFNPFYTAADIFINGIFWNRRAPAFFTIEEMQKPDFKIKVIADVTCDLAPESSVPSTIRPSTILEPVYGFNPHTGKEEDAFQPHCIDVMAIDNLPNELPRDASRAFGEMFLNPILGELDNPDSALIKRASLTSRDGELTEPYHYLQDFVMESTC